MENDTEGFIFALSVGFESDDEFRQLLRKEYAVQGLFDTERGQVVRLHIVRRTKTSLLNEDLIQVGDSIIINIRHEVIDGTAINVFISDLVQAYKRRELIIDKDAITYLDYTVYQRQINRSTSVAYWARYLDGLKIKLSRMIARMPSDRPLFPNLSHASTPVFIPFHLDDKIVSMMTDCARENNVTIASLCLGCHFAFLIELTDEWDLGVCSTVTSRPIEPEAVSILGPFFDFIVYRINLDKKTNPTFVTLVQQTHAIMTEIFDHLFAEQDPCSLDPLKEELSHLLLCCFQFDEKIQDVILDIDVRLCPALDPSDGMPKAIWWRFSTIECFLCHVLYDSKVGKLTHAFIFSTASFERSTAVSIIDYFFILHI